MSNATGDGALLLGGLGSYEAILFHRGNGAVDLHYYHDEGKLAWCQTTTDLGRTWSGPRPVRTRSGEQVRGRHFGIVRLKSGRLAMIHGQPPSPRRHRDFPSVIRTSDDEGETWSEATYLHPDPAVMR